MKSMLSFGLGYTFSQRVWQLRTLINPLVVGKLAGAEGVAFVALAVRVAESLGFVRVAAGRLAIAGLSRLQTDPAQLRRALQNALELQVITLGPLLCGFALCGPALIPRAFGIRWLPSLDVYPWVAAGVLINSVFNLQASALFVLGEQWAVLRSYAAHVLLFGAGTMLLLPRFGVRGYGWADLLACAAYALLHRRLTYQIQLCYSRLARWCLAFGAVFLSMSLREHCPWILWGLCATLFLPDLRAVVQRYGSVAWPRRLARGPDRAESFTSASQPLDPSIP
jgi:PST family polysaccharide transporter